MDVVSYSELYLLRLYTLTLFVWWRGGGGGGLCCECLLVNFFSCSVLVFMILSIVLIDWYSLTSVTNIQLFWAMWWCKLHNMLKMFDKTKTEWFSLVIRVNLAVSHWFLSVQTWHCDGTGIWDPTGKNIMLLIITHVLRFSDLHAVKIVWLQTSDSRILPFSFFFLNEERKEKEKKVVGREGGCETGNTWLLLWRILCLKYT